MGFSGDRTGDLEIFTVVVDAGSFSAAGRRLGLAPSSIGRIIDRIEARLGVRLLLRTTRSLALTAEGAAYLSAARRILSGDCAHGGRPKWLPFLYMPRAPGSEP